jgi:zinc transporter, ZIP family
LCDFVEGTDCDATGLTRSGCTGRAGSSEAGPALALGAFLDGIPEQLVLGIGLATGGAISVGLLASEGLQGGINGFAAGALLVMLVDSMIPDATAKTGKVAGIATVLGFAVAAALSGAST